LLSIKINSIGRCILSDENYFFLSFFQKVFYLVRYVFYAPASQTSFERRYGTESASSVTPVGYLHVSVGSLLQIDSFSVSVHGLRSIWNKICTLFKGIRYLFRIYNTYPLIHLGDFFFQLFVITLNKTAFHNQFVTVLILCIYEREDFIY